MKALCPAKACIVVLFLAATTIASPAQVYTDLANFELTNGGFPFEISLIQGTDGNFYGTTGNGGDLTCSPPSGCGTVFRVTPKGTITVLHSFSGPDGETPAAGLIQARDGNFYGTTAFGALGFGTLFRITATGVFNTLHKFVGAEGQSPEGTLVQGVDGSLYGVAVVGGDFSCYPPNGCGTIFVASLDGKVRALHKFKGNDGNGPLAGMILADNGKFYGSTVEGGNLSCNAPLGCGTIFEMTAGGKLKTLHIFEGSDGQYVYGALVHATDGNFYGTAIAGGDYTCDPPDGCGTVFKLAPAGLTVLHTFESTDGADPSGSLIQATDGNFYGTNEVGGPNSCAPYLGCGNIFEITSSGTFTILHNFNGVDGSNILGGLLQATNGTFYGTTNGGGDDTCDAPSGCGSVYSLSVGLGPFVMTRPTFGPVGENVVILGTDLGGAWSVEFNGKPAKFVVASNTEIRAVVPPGATTGRVRVMTPAGALESNVDFDVP